MRLQRAAVLTVLATAAMPAAAGVLDLNVNGDAARLAVGAPLAQFAPSGRGDLEAGVLYRDEDSADLLNYHAGWMVHGDVGASGAEVIGGLGLRLQWTDLDVVDGSGIALGGDLAIRPEGFERIILRGAIWYQPDVLGFGDIDNQLEWSSSVAYELIRDAELYLGYREWRTQLEYASSEVIDDGIHVGLRIAF